MILRSNQPEFYNDISESIRAYFPKEEIIPCEDGEGLADSEELKDREVLTIVAHVHDTSVQAVATLHGKQCEVVLPLADTNALTVKRMRKRAVKLAVFRLLRDSTGRELPWGSLTGIRPTRLVYEGENQAAALSALGEVYFVHQSKLALLEEIIHMQRPYIQPPARSMDIYIGIPFCKSRCVYCSFASHDATKQKLVTPYLEALFTEIDAVAKFLNEKDIVPRCLYIGGGTPTALNEQQLGLLLEKCAALRPSLEFTVEAGRPDTINSEKLSQIKAAGASRISINPQTMQAESLQLIGRKHTPKEIVACYKEALGFGYESINMDVIAGLPGEDAAMFADTLEKILAMSPQNITVHTLSVKRGSVISENSDKYPMPPEEVVADMVAYARERLGQAGYAPYYLYRQKYQAGNLENVGYCRAGLQGVYNIDIMEETVSILALGAGGVSKRVFPYGGRIERCGNSKSIYDYNARVEEMIAKKLALFEDF